MTDVHRHAADSQPRHARAEAALPAQGDQRRVGRRARHHRAGRRLRRRRHPHARRARRRLLRRQRRQDLHHLRRRSRLRHHRGAHRSRWPSRHLAARDPDRHARLLGRPQARQDGLALLRHRGAGLRGLPRAGRQPARARERGLQGHHGELPDRAPDAGDDGLRRAPSWRCSRRSNTPRPATRSAGR